MPLIIQMRNNQNQFLRIDIVSKFGTCTAVSLESKQYHPKSNLKQFTLTHSLSYFTTD